MARRRKGSEENREPQDEELARKLDADSDQEDEELEDEESDEMPAGNEDPSGESATMELVTVMQAHDMREAKTMKSILESAEIPAFIGAEDSDAEGGEETSALQGIPVLVPEDMAGEAAEILADAAMDDEEEEEEELDEEEWDDEEDDDDDYLDFDDLDDDEEDEDGYDDDLEDLDEDDDF